MTDAELDSAVAAGVLASEESHRRLLESIVEVARSILHAQASSIMLLDDETNELIFEGVAGEGSKTLVGRRFPAREGIAGWVVLTGETLALGDLSREQRFAAEVAVSTGYVPSAVMAVPLIHNDATLGVLEVLDADLGGLPESAALELLELFGRQAAIALDIVRCARRARRVLAEHGGYELTVSRVADELRRIGDRNGSDAGLRLLTALRDVLAAA